LAMEKQRHGKVHTNFPGAVSLGWNGVTTEDSTAGSEPAGPVRFFQRVDWLGFGVTALAAFAVYFYTLAPEVDLYFSGIFCTSAFYPSPSMPPGHPVWALYGWVFIKLIPFSNIAWRLAVASAVAASLTCGLIALMVSRVGILAVDGLGGFQRRSAREEMAIRVVCGGVAGLGFGFEGGYWRTAVVADTWPLSLGLFALTLCLLTRWFFTGQPARYLYAAALLHGLNLAESQALFPAMLALPFLVAMAHRHLARAMFLGLCAAAWAALFLRHRPTFMALRNIPNWSYWPAGATTIALTAWSSSVFNRTGRFLSEWKSAAVCGVLLVAGLGANLLLPVYSMTTPPINWNYARTVDGFIFLLARGQFEAINPISDFGRLVDGWIVYGKTAANLYGVLYLLAAAVPFLMLRKAAPAAQKWLLGMLAVWFFVSLPMIVALNMTIASMDSLNTTYFAPTHLVLALLAGVGLTMVGYTFGKSGGGGDGEVAG